MKIEYDTALDLLNLEFLADVPIHDSLEVDGVVIDYAKDKRIVAIELLDAGKRTTRQPLDLIDLAIVRSRSHAANAEEGHREGKAQTPAAIFQLKVSSETLLDDGCQTRLAGLPAAFIDQKRA